MDNIDIIMQTIKTDSSGKWVSVEEVRRLVEGMLQPKWDEYSGLPAPKAYEE
jgi:hypothetical protein